MVRYDGQNGERDVRHDRNGKVIDGQNGERDVRHYRNGNVRWIEW